ncbi:hypothetical protein ACFWY9_41620 [Amycolatopsis sp. NPDC059027]|uniref:hypothetical protein n=1 Tax=unclassified Amycolatopsis TaxID=2618356 RepID=UPI00366E810B
MTRRVLAAAVLLATLTACGVEPSGVQDGGKAPTGVARGVTLYFVDAEGELVPSPRPTQRLGTITDALNLLVASSSSSQSDGLHSAFAWQSALGRSPLVTESDELIRINLPLAKYEIAPLGVDQFVCTALGVHRQAGKPAAKVVVTYTIGGDTEPLSCPVLR